MIVTLNTCQDIGKAMIIRDFIEELVSGMRADYADFIRQDLITGWGDVLGEKCHSFYQIIRWP